MTETTILDAGSHAAESEWIEVPVGSIAHFSMFMKEGDVPREYSCMRIVRRTPGADREVAALSSFPSTQQISGPGAYRVVRKAGPYSAGATAQVFNPYPDA